MLNPDDAVWTALGEREDVAADEGLEMGAGINHGWTDPTRARLSEPRTLRTASSVHKTGDCAHTPRFDLPMTPVRSTNTSARGDSVTVWDGSYDLDSRDPVFMET